MSNNKRAVHIDTVTTHHNGKTYVSHLLRHTYRDQGKVKHLTLGNLSDLPDDLIQVILKRLAGEPLPSDDDDFQIVRSLPHGHVSSSWTRTGAFVGVPPAFDVIDQSNDRLSFGKSSSAAVMSNDMV